MTHCAAILTGDLVQSTQAPQDQIDLTMGVLAKVAATIGDNTRFTRFRGDGWQIYLHHPGQCLLACMLILARLKAAGTLLSTRISVGIGVTLPLPEGDLSAASGDAFTASGRGLDAMTGQQILAIDGKEVDLFQKAVFAFAADRATRWSHQQAEAVALALDPAMPSRATIATRLGITRQAVDARLAAAGYRLLDDASLAFIRKYSPEARENPHD